MNKQDTNSLQNLQAKAVKHTYKFEEDFNNFLKALGATRQMTVSNGQYIELEGRAQDDEVHLADGNVAEGELIPLSHVTPSVLKKEKIELKKYRKVTTGEAMLRYGSSQAVDRTDEGILRDILKDIRRSLFDVVQSGEEQQNLAAGGGLQGALATGWTAMQVIFDDEDTGTIAFVNPLDMGEAIANKEITLENQFGINYYTSVTGTIIFKSNHVEAGSIYVTAPENLIVAKISPSENSDLDIFNFVSDKSGFVGMVHVPTHNTFSQETVAISGVRIFPERLDGIVKVSLGKLNGPEDPVEDDGGHPDEGDSVHFAVTLDRTLHDGVPFEEVFSEDTVTVTYNKELDSVEIRIGEDVQNHEIMSDNPTAGDYAYRQFISYGESGVEYGLNLNITDLDMLTVEELKQALDDYEIEYPPGALKQELMELVFDNRVY